jgi:putative Mg2+ transporter-C (MgtC) family protein
VSTVAAVQIGIPLGGQGWKQVGDLALALLLSAAVGLEREWRQKDAGLRTHTLVGVGAALFMLVSKYGFSDVAVRGLVLLDPSRVAAQIVSGIGFLGAGLIFIRRDSVRGLTTAASIWVVAAIGSAAGANLPVLALLTTGMFFVVVAVFPPLVQRLPASATAISAVRVRYADGRGLLRDILAVATERGFTIDDVATETISATRDADGRKKRNGVAPIIEVTLHVHGKQPVAELAAALTELDYVEAVLARDVETTDA